MNTLAIHCGPIGPTPNRTRATFGSNRIRCPNLRSRTGDCPEGQGNGWRSFPAPKTSLPNRVANRLIAMLAALLVAGAAFTGCATFSNPDSKAMLLADLQDIAQVGATFDLIGNPGHRARYEEVIAGLDALSTTTNASPADLHKILLTLPIRQLKSEKATLIVTALNITMRRIMGGRELVIPEDVREVAKALAAGLREAMVVK